MPSFYANENFPRRAVEALRALGHDVLTTQEAGNAGQAMPDREVLDFAIRTDRVVLTLNRRDFVRLHMQGIAHAGVVVCSEDTDPQHRPRESTTPSWLCHRSWVSWSGSTFRTRAEVKAA